MRLGILTTHPIQYQAPWFRALAAVTDLEVFFAHRQSATGQAQAGFGVAFEWDVDLLSGYPHRFLENVSPTPNADSFGGCDTPEIREIIRRGKFDAFIVNGWYVKAYWQAIRACRRARVPVLVRGDSQLGTPRSAWFNAAKEVLYRVLLRQFDGFLTVGKRNRAYLEHYGAAPGKIFNVPHFVDNAWFAHRSAEARPQRAEMRRGWGAGEEDFVALFAGKFIPKKRPADLLQALASCQKQGEQGMGVFVGDGPLATDLRAEAAQLGVKARFVGFKNQTELPGCYAAADALVLPSDGGETWGLVVNEAMACGLPAVVSDAAGCGPDLIEEGVTGYTFPLGDPAGLAQQLGRLAAQKTAGHDFTLALATKLADYNVERAVAGTLTAVAAVSQRKP